MLLDYTADQAKQRRYVRLEDQFGRWWGAQVEKSTGDPCSEVSPFGGWSDPLKTPNIYLRPPHHEDGTTVSGKINVDFDRWMDSIRGSEEDWNVAIQAAGKETYKITTRAERLEWPNDPILQAIAGPRPLPTLETLMKARDGDKRLLGGGVSEATTEIHPVDITYREFVSENRRDEFGKVRKFAAIAKLWNEHKANLKDEEVDEVVEKKEIPELEEVEA